MAKTVYRYRTRTASRRSKGIAGTGVSEKTALLVGGGALALYLLTRSGAAGGGGEGPAGGEGPPGESIFQQGADTITKAITSTMTGVVEAVTGGVAGVAVAGAGIPGQVVFGVPKKMIEISEEQVSTDVFGGQKRTGVSAFMATAPPGSIFTQPVTYKEFIAEQPLAFRVAAGTGNIIGATYPAQYGAYMAEETKKGMALGGVSPEETAARFAQLPWWQQIPVTVGQMFTVPLGGGGAMGWGAQQAKAGEQWTKEREGKEFSWLQSKWVPTKKEAAISVPDTKKESAISPPVLPFQKEATQTYGSNVIAKAYWGNANTEVFGPPSPTKKELKIPAGYSAERGPGMDVWRMVDGQKVWR